MIPLSENDLLPAELAHMTLLERWRGAMDLVGPGPLLPHFLDCAAAVSWLGELAAPGGVWADLGSGAGFPGVALAARYPALQVQLVESRLKRSLFLDQVVVETGLKNVSILNCRTNKLKNGSVNGVVSRAYRAPEAYLSDCSRLLAPGGVAVLMLARQAPPELPGLRPFHVERYDLGGRPRQAVGYMKE